jgi:hypothetical protein
MSESGQSDRNRKKEDDIVTVNINRGTYVLLKSKAEDRRYSVKDYVNELLDSYVKKYEFVDTQWPGLSVEGFDPNNKNHIILKDSKKRKFFDVWLYKDELKCEQDDSKCCIHTRYVWLIPEFSKLGIKEPK